METAHFQLSVVSADQRLPSQIVEVESEWTTIDLKKHLSKVYPGEPPIDSQKLIFAGRILSDDSKLRSILGHNSLSSTVHLVLSPSVANQAKAAMTVGKSDDISEEELSELRAQYLQYLAEFNGNACAQPNGFSFGSQPSVQCNEVNLEEDDDDDDDELNVEIEVEQDVQQQPGNALQRLVGAIGFQAAQEGAFDQDNEMAPGEAFDLFDFAYTVFRLGFMLAICITYASWQRMALVTAVAMYFYWRNGDRQNAAHQQPVEPPQQAQQAQWPAPSVDAPNENSTVADASNSPPQSEAAAPTEAASPQTQSQVATGVAGGQSDVEEVGRVGKIAEALRAFGGMSVQLVYAIFSSLVPELPARID
ncbi:unnamed protein product [Mesocestoides corti]|uniref:Ubiquitin-like domain-containing protein n=1 Tax=Mesocestoides corti TaxID=53468 RepID=A0A0R3U857_MESCO|nr:unnamed protein product [Mesocestoides corti]